MEYNLTHIGTDISTMEAIESLFRDRADPWALDCLANWIDVTVNHANTFYALPKSLDALPGDVVFPNVLLLAEEKGLIGPADSQASADQIELHHQEIERLYLIFEAWASTNLHLLKEWLYFTTSVRRINAGRFIDEGPLNRYVRDKFWSNRPQGWLIKERESHGIGDDSQRLAFDMVVRAAQYHVAFGTTRAYQPHPIRSLYAPPSHPTQPQPQSSVSWGWLVIRQIAEGHLRCDKKRLIDTVLQLKTCIAEERASATELAGNDKKTRNEKLNRIAVGLGVEILPTAFREWVHRITVGIGIPLELVAEAHGIPFVGVAWEVIQIPIKRTALELAQHLKFVQRRVAFPDSLWQRPSLKDVRRNLK